MKKGNLPTQMLAILVIALVCIFILFLIFSSVTADSPNMINTFVNNILDSILKWFT